MSSDRTTYLSPRGIVSLSSIRPDVNSHDHSFAVYPSAPHRAAALARAAAVGRLLLGIALLSPARAQALPPASAAHTRPVVASNTPLHDVHLTYSRVVVDGASVIFRVRLFHDDLEKALQVYSRNPALKVVTSPAADSAFAAYFNAQVPVTANGRRLVGRVIQSGKDMDVTDQEMWWYLVELTAPAPITTLSLRVGLMFEHFTDQKNIVTMLKMPGEKRYSLYFVREDAKEQSVTF